MDYYGWMRFKHRLLLPLLLLSLTFPVQAQPENSPESSAKSSALDSGLFYQLLLGELNARGDEPAAAFSLILDAARRTNNPSLYRRAVHIALQARSGESAIQAAKAWSQAAPASKDASHYVLQVLLGLNRTAETLVPLKRELALTSAKELRETIWSIPTMFERASDRTLAASTVRTALAGYLKDPVLGPTAWAAVGRMALAAGDQAAGLSAASNGLALDPRAEHPALLALTMMDTASTAAEDLVKKHLPHARPEFRMAYIKALLNAKRETNAKEQLGIMQVQNPEYPDAWLINGALALQEGQLDQAQRQLLQYLGLTETSAKTPQETEFLRGRTQAFFSMAHIAQQRKDFKRADDWLQRVNHPEDIMRAQIRRAALMADQGQLEEALLLIRNQPVHSPDDAQLRLSAEIQLLREHKQFVRARSLLQTGLAQNPDNLDMVYDLAMVHEKLGELDDMERLLRSLMLSRPDDPHAYNALGYSLADRGVRLSEAKTLISKALQLSPNDAFITDSMAWAEFRSDNLTLALQLLQGAFNEKPDAEIAAHMGEVLWALKRQPEALEIWRKGLQLNPGNEALLDTLKRLQVSL